MSSRVSALHASSDVAPATSLYSPKSACDTIDIHRETYRTEGPRRRICHAADHRWKCTMSRLAIAIALTAQKNAKSTLINAALVNAGEVNALVNAYDTLGSPQARFLCYRPDSCDVHADPKCMLTQIHLSRFSPNHAERSQGSKLYAIMCSTATNVDLANLS